VTEQRPAIADRTPIFALLSAEAVGQVGNMMTIVAGPWFVLQTTGSAAKTGLVSAALVLGSVLPVVVGGPLVDQLGFKRASILADVASAVAVATIPLLTWQAYSPSGNSSCSCSYSRASTRKVTLRATHSYPPLRG
jgi:MFS family permease